MQYSCSDIIHAIEERMINNGGSSPVPGVLPPNPYLPVLIGWGCSDVLRNGLLCKP